MGGEGEGVKGATADFVCFYCPLVAPAGAIPPAGKAPAEKKIGKTSGIQKGIQWK